MLTPSNEDKMFGRIHGFLSKSLYKEILDLRRGIHNEKIHITGNASRMNGPFRRAKRPSSQNGTAIATVHTHFPIPNLPHFGTLHFACHLAVLRCFDVLC